ncbi:hypothetical protein T459_22386 [Capsicum annuum]|uniref:Uncharacterized protein n=1 Tax=Capsicum annuum TaxID=4072 RepID=A0A2G2YPQ6_CAPAN|nr:hypothetical protein T459_22386 [Capsicum annuum]
MVVTVKSTRPKAEILRFLSSATVYLYHVDLLSRVKGQVESLHRELSLMKAFLKVSWEKRSKRREQGIFRPNRCAMARGFGGGLGVRACCLPKIDQGMQGRLAII